MVVEKEGRKEVIFNSVVALVLYSITAIFLKMATQSVNVAVVTFVTLWVGVIVSLVFGVSSGFGTWNFAGVFFAVIAGVVGTIGNIFEYKAITDGRASVVKCITDLVPAFVLILEIVILKESILAPLS